MGLREVEFRLANGEILKGWFHCWSTVADSDGSDCYATVEDEKGECYHVFVGRIRFLDRPDRKPVSSPIVEFLKDKTYGAYVYYFSQPNNRILGVRGTNFVVYNVDLRENAITDKLIETSDEAEAVKALAGR